MSMRALGFALLLAGQALAADRGPLPGEIVTRIGQVAAIPADQRKVPGFAGSWRHAAAQDKVLERIVALESRVKPCTDVRVVDTVQAAPDLIETRPQRIHHALERWTVNACGATRQYDAWYSFEKSASRLMVAESGTGDFQATLDPPYRRLLELAAARSAEEAGGNVRWLNLPLPADSMPVANASSAAGWSADFVPVGDSPREWTQLVSVQGLPRLKSAGQARALLEGMQQARGRRCGVAPGAVDAVPGEEATSGTSVQTYLVCPQVPDTNYAEIAVVKAIEGPDYLYVIQRAWRLPAADAARIQFDSRQPKAAAEAFLAQVRLCNPASDRPACPSPFPR
jgi:hypothetical protein